MKRVIGVCLMMLVIATTVGAQTIAKRDVQMAWEASEQDAHILRGLINVYTALQESGYRSFSHFFQFFQQYHARVKAGRIELVEGQDVVGGFLDYLAALSKAIGTPQYDEYYQVVFAWNQSVRVTELLEHIAFLRPYLLDEDVRALARENIEAAKKLLNILDKSKHMG